MAQQNFSDPNFLRGDWESFSPGERDTRNKYIELVLRGSLVPIPEWLVDLGDGVSGDAASQVATGIYNILADSRSTENLLPAGGLRQIIETGGDAELWSLIRVALNEAYDGRLAALCRDRGFRVFKIESRAAR